MAIIIFTINKTYDTERWMLGRINGWVGKCIDELLDE